MLAITRKPGEGFLVGEAMVRVVEVSHGRVKLRVDAPGHVPISREEMLVPTVEGALRHPDFILSRQSQFS